jgi:hypothetical protein
MAGPVPSFDDALAETSPALLTVALASHLPPPERAEVIVVLTLDGVRWQEVFEGVERDRARAAGLPEEAVVSAARLMPNLHWLITTRGAAVGAPGAGVIAASGPNFVSLPGYVELFTGDPASGGCETNDCGRVDRPTLADELSNGDPKRVAVFSSWPTIARAASREPEGVLISAGRRGTSHPELLAGDPVLQTLVDAGERSGARPGYGSYRPDRHTAALALRYLRQHPPRLLFLGLGDTDEWAHQDDYPHYLEALRQADRVIGELAIHLADLSAGGTPTLLLITTDHGRSHGFVDHGRVWPESARIWLVAAGDPVRARGRVASPRSRRLADVTATLRAVAGLPSSAGQGRVLSELFVPATREPLARR